MAYPAHITPARLNPSWTPATEPLGPLERFFNRRGPSAAVASPAPVRPTPARELVAC